MVDKTKYTVPAVDLPQHIEDDIICDESGFYIYWPSPGRGGHTSANLRQIADRLDKLNAPWERQITKYFEKQDE